MQFAKTSCKNRYANESQNGLSGTLRLRWGSEYIAGDGKVSSVGMKTKGATMMFGSVARHVSWMAIPCPRAATGNDCPASPQGAPQKHTRKHTHTFLSPGDQQVVEEYG